MTKNTRKKKRPFKRYFKQYEIAEMFGYKNQKSFSATSSKVRILSAVDQIISHIEKKLL